MNEIAAAPTMSAQEDLDQRSDETHSESAQDDGVPHDSDDEPMVYEIPHDYAVSARQERDHLIAAGVSLLMPSSYKANMTDMIALSNVFRFGPGSGATKGEFRGFSRWFEDMLEAEQMHEVPEKWLKFEKPAERRFDL
ncbi:hypothetical protein BDV32DRAFT_151248 [Aspergillus pseudonomiae]|nr:hypothetical protein BDV32DRAFT_151248 [Aspergillus pseudonomiae]